MKSLSAHIAHAKQQPHHIRKNIAFVTAGVGTVLIALVWFTGSLVSGTFSIRESNFAESVGQGQTVEHTSVQTPTGIAGAAAALPTDETPAHIQIVDTASSTSPVRQVEQTTIPF